MVCFLKIDTEIVDAGTSNDTVSLHFGNLAPVPVGAEDQSSQHACIEYA